MRSGQWHRVAALRPRLAGHALVHRHVYRRTVWYALENRASGQHHRFDAIAWRVIRRFDGRTTLQALWDELQADAAADTPTQEEIVVLLGRLNAANLLRAEVTPDVAELLERGARQERRQILGRFANPLSLRLPLWNPDAFLDHAVRWLPPVPAWLALGLWVAWVGAALVALPPHWREIGTGLGDRLLAAHNLWLLAVAFPLLKAAHELAHGFAVKRHGGRVHEMGLMLLMLYPAPYVDASAANAFASKRARIGVSAAGMLAETALAALAFFAWLALEPGLARSIAYNVMVVGGVTTLLFNANPLLRYDGYFILADLLEIPNLAQRANAHVLALAARRLLGVRSIELPPATRAERRLFLAYAPLAFAYRLSVTIGLAWFVAQHYFVVGVLLAAWGLGAGLLWPLARGAATIATDPNYASRRLRVAAGLGGTLLALFGVLFVLPMPYHTRALGIVWLPERALVRAQASGFVSSVDTRQDRWIAAGEPVVLTFDPSLNARLAEQAARVAEAEARLDAAWVRPAEAGRIGEALKRERAAHERLADEAARMALRTGTAGRLKLDRPGDLPGRWLAEGEVVGHVLGHATPYVKVVVTQEDADRVRSATAAVAVLLPQAFDAPVAGRLLRAVPKAAYELPSAALGTSGGGPIATDPRDPKGVQALQSMFEFDVELPALADASNVFVGSHAHVSFEHPPEPLAWRWLHRLRTQLLSQFQV